MSFESQIQQWVLIDNQIKQINEKTKELREKRNLIEENIIQYTKTNNIKDSSIRISDGKLKITNTRIPEPLTFKYLEKSLSEIIKNESQLNLIINHLKQNRSIKNIEEIKRVSNN